MNAAPVSDYIPYLMRELFFYYPQVALMTASLVIKDAAADNQGTNVHFQQNNNDSGLKSSNFFKGDVLLLSGRLQ
jgi:hypothetical protein